MVSYIRNVSTSEALSSVRGVLRLLAVASLVGTAAPVGAQSPEAQSPEPPSNAPVQVGPLAVAPAIRLANFGYDNNVFNRDSDNNPIGDLMATLSPAVNAWLRLPHVRMNGRSQFDFYYFKKLTDLRALDTDNRAHFEVELNRLTPFVEGTFANTRHRQNLEIDALSRRQNSDVHVGADVRLTGKIFAGVHSHRSGVKYEANSFYLNTDLARVLNHRSSGEGAVVRWVVTPYTTFAVEMDRERERFDFAADRNADSVQVAPSVEFNPLALISGRASIGFLRRRFLKGGVPEFKGTVAFADLAYTFRERTRLSLAGRRRLEYSYLVELRDYIDQEITAAVAQRLGESWDASGSVGRGRIGYGVGSMGSAPSDETILSTSLDIGYTLGRTRVGFRVEGRTRQTDRRMLNRGYNRLRIGSNLTYAFQ